MNLVDLPIEELRKYKPDITMEKDFNEFWERAVEESKSSPLNIEKRLREDYDYVEGAVVYDVEFSGFRNSKIHCTYGGSNKD